MFLAKYSPELKMYVLRMYNTGETASEQTLDHHHAKHQARVVPCKECQLCTQEVWVQIFCYYSYITLSNIFFKLRFVIDLKQRSL